MAPQTLPVLKLNLGTHSGHPPEDSKSLRCLRDSPETIHAPPSEPIQINLLPKRGDVDVEKRWFLFVCLFKWGLYKMMPWHWWGSRLLLAFSLLLVSIGVVETGLGAPVPELHSVTVMGLQSRCSLRANTKG